MCSGRRQITPEIKQSVAALTAHTDSLLDKVAALAAFVQRGVRYVAIEIGIGGYQPHSAQSVLANRYGDCKDKVTLLSAMLQELGIDSYYVLVHSERGAVAPNFPSVTNFNHVILAIRLPEDLGGLRLYAVQDHARLGRLLYFDPTDPVTPLGYLPSGEQAAHGLLVSEGGGELVELPSLLSVTNRLMRVGKWQLGPTGALSGGVREVRWGGPAYSRRAAFLMAPLAERAKVVEDFLGIFLRGFRLTRATVENLEDYDQNLVLDYRFESRNYAQRAGNLLIFRGCVLGRKGSQLFGGKPRNTLWSLPRPPDSRTNSR